jgi:NAD(P)-dependent dehydrogenase (short-subunit alcohol dehydrogenase family)
MVYLAEEKARDDNIPLEKAIAILTAETVLKRYGDPEELAAMVVFLASNKSTYTTGASFDIDGGQVKAL